MIAASEQILWLSPSPLEFLPEVSLGEDRWATHIVANHTEMRGKEMNVKAAVSYPTVIVPGKWSGSYIFVNHDDVRSNDSPIIVVVNAVKATIVTALYDRRYAIVEPEAAVWLRP